MRYSISLDGKQELGQWFAEKPGQIQRATRNTVNQFTTLIHKEAGSTIPRVVASSVAGFKRVRAKKTLAKARRKRIQGVTWIGENEIAGIYAKGKLRKVEGGIVKGVYFFENAFVRTMKSGHTGIFYRVGKKLKEATFVVEPQTKGTVRSIVDRNIPGLKALISKNLTKELNRKK